LSSEALSKGVIQKNLSHQIDLKTSDDLASIINSEDGASYRLCLVNELTQMHASDWLSVIPNTALGLALSSEEFSVLIRYRLCQDIIPSDISCPGCKSQTLDKKGIHALECSAWGDKTRRHNAIRNSILGYCKSAGLNAVIEKSGLIAGNKKRPGDVYIESLAKGLDYALDVAITSPFTLDAMASRPKDGNLARYYDIKIKNLSAEIRNADFHFAPIIISTMGQWESSAYEIIGKIAKMIANRSFTSYAVTMSQMFQKLSISLQRSNARAILSRLPTSKGDYLFNNSNNNLSVHADVDEGISRDMVAPQDDISQLPPDISLQAGLNPNAVEFVPNQLSPELSRLLFSAKSATNVEQDIADPGYFEPISHRVSERKERSLRKKLLESRKPADSAVLACSASTIYDTPISSRVAGRKLRSKITDLRSKLWRRKALEPVNNADSSLRENIDLG
jgi:hypothetical protein